jgi:serine/threonine-protein phosphatase 5
MSLGTRTVSVMHPVTSQSIRTSLGQYYDLLHLLTLTGKPSEKHCMLFNGDFVDRGSWSVEVVLTLMAWKWLLPRSVYLNRGNHETKDMNKVRMLNSPMSGNAHPLLFEGLWI